MTTTISKSEGKSSEEYLILVAYVATQAHGALLNYNDVQHFTGVKMDVGGKEKLRRAILKNKREYTVVRKVGYELGSAHKSTMIISFRLRRIDSQVKRGGRAHSSLTSTFSKEFTVEERRAMDFANTILNATNLAIEDSAKLFSKNKPVPMLSIPLPNVPI